MKTIAGFIVLFLVWFGIISLGMGEVSINSLIASVISLLVVIAVCAGFALAISLIAWGEQ
jgi:hypothetical protein